MQANSVAIGTLIVVSAMALCGEERLAFEVAAIKPPPPSARASFFEISPGGERFTATNASLKLLIMAAYGVGDRQVSGGPAWVNSEGFNVEAKAEHPASRDQVLQMLQELLADRFRLKIHEGTREVPIYVLAVDGSAFGFRENKTGDKPRVRTGAAGQMVFESVPITQLVWFLSVRLHRDVIDKTGLGGSYDFELSYTPVTPSFGDAASNPAGVKADRPPLQEAVRDQLGLRLQSQRGPTKIFVIDHAEKPALD